ncbi:hypothetical protein ACPCVL_07490 [Streptomyces koyangensis]|uniref:hypothetical protein n=1 Tax=Streptomyces koyangensis TaxID=188770 RepID=UPI003C2AF7B1
MSKDNRGLAELTVTPLISRAIAVLRTAVPSQLVRVGAIGIVVGFTEFGLSGGGDIVWAKSVRQAPMTQDVPLTDAQEAAAWMLVGTAAFYDELWREAAGLRGDVDANTSPTYRRLSEQFNQNVRRTLNIEVDGYVYDRHLSGRVTVYL